MAKITKWLLIWTGAALLGVATKKIFVNKIPDYLLNHFKNNDWYINETTENIIDDKGNKHSGVINFKTKTITVNNKKSIYHEFGHYLDYVCKISDTDEFIKVYEKERNKTDFSNYHKSTPSEYFAESFSQYILKGDSNLETYRYIKDCLKEVKNENN